MEDRLRDCIQMAGRYEMPALKKRMEDGLRSMEERPFGIGLFGQHFQRPLYQAGEITGLTFLKELRPERAYAVRFRYGEKNAYYREGAEEHIKEELPDGGPWEEELSEEEFQEWIETEAKAGGLLWGSVTLALEWLRDMELTVIGVDSSYEPGDICWPELLLGFDECCMLLAGDRMFAQEERRMIRGCLLDQKENASFLVTRMELVNEEEREAVLHSAKKVLKDFKEEALEIADEDVLGRLPGMWENRKNQKRELLERRQKQLFCYGRKLLLTKLERRLEILKKDSESVREMVSMLSGLKGQLAECEQKAERHIRICYLKELEVLIESELIAFNERLKQELKEGIEEEDDTGKLEEYLTGFLMGAWEDFIREELDRRLQEKMDAMDAGIESYIQENLESYLKDCFGEEAYRRLEEAAALLLKTRGEDFTGEMKPQTGEQAVVVKREDAIALLIPKCFFAAGAAAGLAGFLLPGIALFAMGGRLELSRAAKQEKLRIRLLEDGRRLSDECLSRLFVKLKEIIGLKEEEIRERIRECYGLAVSQLIAVLEEQQQGQEERKEAARAAEADIERLKAW